MQDFFVDLDDSFTSERLEDFCQKKILDGIPYVFKDREDEYYEFRKKIAEKFKIRFNDVYITGSARLGFSYHKRTEFNYDSDIDIALVSRDLFDFFMDHIHKFQLKLHYNLSILTRKELESYHRFLRYTALGWIRPDLLPIALQLELVDIKKDWFNFFNAISNGKSEVGNYEVTAGVFKTYDHLVAYTILSLKQVKNGRNE